MEHVPEHPPKQCPLHEPALQPVVFMDWALHVEAQLRVHPLEHVPLHPLLQPLQPVEPPSKRGSSISQDVSNLGTVIATNIGKAVLAAFLKNVLLVTKSILLFIASSFKNKDQFLNRTQQLRFPCRMIATLMID